eukprot:TRINITY_DN18223_c0_g1_i1.p1 TRINITY_DN18223_c0_g1~~TRINITY_DN18223_c0_g1_i1.p1  ORF type:complete len:1513 (+),score=489.61 TRINITY_DN18223_c0_g1_i1:269-4540(+)
MEGCGEEVPVWPARSVATASAACLLLPQDHANRYGETMRVCVVDTRGCIPAFDKVVAAVATPPAAVALLATLLRLSSVVVLAIPDQPEAHLAHVHAWLAKVSEPGAAGDAAGHQACAPAVPLCLVARGGVHHELVRLLGGGWKKKLMEGGVFGGVTLAAVEDHGEALLRHELMGRLRGRSTGRLTAEALLLRHPGDDQRAPERAGGGDPLAEEAFHVYTLRTAALESAGGDTPSAAPLAAKTWDDVDAAHRAGEQDAIAFLAAQTPAAAPFAEFFAALKGLRRQAAQRHLQAKRALRKDSRARCVQAASALCAAVDARLLSAHETTYESYDDWEADWRRVVGEYKGTNGLGPGQPDVLLHVLEKWCLPNAKVVHASLLRRQQARVRELEQALQEERGLGARERALAGEAVRNAETLLDSWEATAPDGAVRGLQGQLAAAAAEVARLSSQLERAADDAKAWQTHASEVRAAHATLENQLNAERVAHDAAVQSHATARQELQTQLLDAQREGDVLKTLVDELQAALSTVAHGGGGAPTLLDTLDSNDLDARPVLQVEMRRLAAETLSYKQAWGRTVADLKALRSEHGAAAAEHHTRSAELKKQLADEVARAQRLQAEVFAYERQHRDPKPVGATATATASASMLSLPLPLPTRPHDVSAAPSADTSGVRANLSHIKHELSVVHARSRELVVAPPVPGVLDVSPIRARENGIGPEVSAATHSCAQQMQAAEARAEAHCARAANLAAELEDTQRELQHWRDAAADADTRAGLAEMQREEAEDRLAGLHRRHADRAEALEVQARAQGDERNEAMVKLASTEGGLAASELKASELERDVADRERAISELRDAAIGQATQYERLQELHQDMASRKEQSDDAHALALKQLAEARHAQEEAETLCATYREASDANLAEAKAAKTELQSHRADAAARIKDLEQKLSDRLTALAKAEGEATISKNAVARLEEARDGLERDMMEAQQEHQEGRLEKKQQLAELRKQLVAAENARVEVQAKLQTETFVLTEDLNGCRSRAAEATRRREEVEKRLVDVEQAAALQQVECESLRQQLESSQGEVARVTEALTQVAEDDKLHSTAAAADLQKLRDAYAAQQTSHLKEKAALHDAVRRLREELTTVKGEHAALQQRVRELEAAEADAAALSEQLKRKAADLAQANSQLDVALANVKENTNLHVHQEAENATVVGAYESEQKRLRKVITDMERRFSVDRNGAVELAKKLATAEERCSALASEEGAAASSTARLKTALSMAEAKLRTTEARVRELEAAVASRDAAIEHLKTKAEAAVANAKRTAQEEARIAQGTVTQLEEKVRTVTAQLQDKASSFRRLESQPSDKRNRAPLPTPRSAASPASSRAPKFGMSVVSEGGSSPSAYGGGTPSLMRLGVDTFSTPSRAARREPRKMSLPKPLDAV